MLIVCTLHTHSSVFFFNFCNDDEDENGEREKEDGSSGRWNQIRSRTRKKCRGWRKKSHWFTISPHCHYCHTHTHTPIIRFLSLEELFSLLVLSLIFMCVVLVCVLGVQCSIFECALRRHVNTIMCRQSMRHVLDVSIATL